MGNRCVVTNEDKSRALYFHWNGGMDTIYPLTLVAKSFDTEFKFEKFVSIAKIVFDAVEMPYKECDCDNGDNGVYILDKELNIIGREFAPNEEQQSHDLLLMICNIITSYFIYRELKDWLYQHEKNKIEEMIKNITYQLHSTFEDAKIKYNKE